MELLVEFFRIFMKFVELNSESLKLIFQIISSIVAIVGIFFVSIQARLARKQYEYNAKWKESQFLSEEVRRFLSDENTRFVLTVIDWRVRRLALNEGQQPVKIDRSFLRSALRTDSNGIFAKEQAMVRDKFDIFFTDFEVFEHYIRDGLVSEHKVEKYFRYWFDLLLGERQDILDRETLAVIWKFIRDYNYDDVVALLSRFGKMPELSYADAEE